ncbi:MAG TPA: acetyl-CoA C-acetyltransferase [Hyphomicrobiaceae bacterium]|nr:acetyl-CoA C-acetyltransferase [Hyphomicrobiaceae bacterium]
MEQTLRRVGVVGGVRIPFCRSNTLYRDQSNLAMLTATLNGLVDRYNLQGVHIDEAIGGAVVTHSKDWNLAREAVLGSKLAPSTPGITLQQACGTSLQAAMILQAKIATGQIECGIAMGSDTTSDAPIVFKEKFAHRLVEAQNAKSFGQRMAAFKGFSPAELAPQPPSVSEPRTGLSMGQHTELMAQEWHISRSEQDRFALESHRKAAEAYRSGYLDDLVVPFAGVFRDNNLREDASLDRLATLKPAFDKSERGTLTAANSTPLTDGAACVLLASETWAASRALPIEAYLTHAQTAANNFVAGDGLLLAPTIAVSRLLERAQLTLQDFDYYEIHEAFAAQVLVTLKAFEDAAYCKSVLGRDAPLGSIDRAKLNVKGSSLAFGHPFAATGARIIANLGKLLAVNGGRGLISVCTAGGMGVAAIMESARAAALQAAA